MAMPLLNQLLEEAVTRCQELSQQAGETGDVADTVLDRSRQLGARVADEGRAALSRFQEVGRALEEAEDKLGAAEEAARRRLERVDARAEEARAEAAKLLDDVEGVRGELESARERTAADLEHQVEEAEERMAELARQIGELGQATQSQVAEALEDMTALGRTVAALRAALPEALLRLHGDLEGLEEAASQAVDQVLDAFEDSMQAHVDGFAELGQTLAAEHNRSVQALVKAFTQDAVAELGDALEPLRRATAALEQLADSGGEAVVARTAEISAAVDVVGTLLGRIHPALAAVMQLR
jgi:chromosome segregation ATPase